MVQAFTALEADDPSEVGPFRIVARLGAGGMGQVYLGVSRGGRSVAVKVVRPDLADDQDFRRRFAREVHAARQVSGLFTAGVVDADPHGVPPWLATVYVPGMSLADAVAAFGALPERSVAALGAGLAEALGAIHAAGVVHRDLKPSNVLLASDGPRVIDFGISAVNEASVLTRTGTVVGTPGFMSPEQLTGRRIGPASDVFSLASVLAFAASGTGPFGTGSLQELLFRIVYREPDLGGVPEGLRTLVARCLAKEPGERPSVPRLLEELAGMAASPAPGDGTPVLGDWLPADLAQTVAVRAAVRLPETLPRTRPGPVPAAPDIRPEPPGDEAGGPESAEERQGPASESPGERQGPAAESPEGRQARQGPASESPEERQGPAAAAGAGGTLVPARRRMSRRYALLYALGVSAVAVPSGVYLLRSNGSSGPWRVRRTITGQAEWVRRVVFSPDGKVLASVEAHGRVGLCDAGTGRRTGTLLAHDSHVWSVAFSPDGKVLATGGGDDEAALRLWDPRTREAGLTLVGHTNRVWSVAFSPDGEVLASSSRDRTVRLWNVRDGGLRATLKGHTDGVNTVAFAPDGRTVASGGGDEDRMIRLWDSRTGEHSATLEGHTDSVWSVTYSPDGKTLASSGADRTVRLWNPRTGSLRATLRGHTEGVNAVAFAPDGRTLVSSGEDVTIRFWDVRTGENTDTLKPTAKADWQFVALSPDGRTLAGGDSEGTIRFWSR
ncbi:protein kinase [Streptomyces phyllanthi]|uniref:Protein kinase n=1 Tax=Streptomyces phyllanthi TaxID=1803180 RepID=A0A5N8VYE2_9ACTN|nr:serine/threonine-protein kinase [Streptomyces phyllanthi]MPY40267.1 protein kinase [Streptomyces phyllanthi]